MKEIIQTSQVVVGNACREGASRRGWFLGHFVDSGDRLLSTTALEVKWGVHAAGESRSQWSTNQSATTLSILIEGRFWLQFPERDVRLTEAGDYVIWAPGTPHIWTAEEASTVLTVRYPSVADDIIEKEGSA